jgi:hypothetical protein
VKAAGAWLAGSALALGGCGAGPLVLDAPEIAKTLARAPSPVELDPIADGAAIVGDYMPPGPAAVLTAAMNTELAGRALHGGESGGYSVRCTLDRFAVRSHASLASMAEAQEGLAVYADLSCEASRSVDHVAVWRGELRARTFAEDANLLGSDASTRQRLVDRALSDAARELASDLALRALGLLAEPSARIFVDAEQQRQRAGLDDSPFGPAALQQTGASSASVQKGLADGNAYIRAAAWNVVAMAAGPGDEWTAGAKLALDDDAGVRFAQYKALARLGSDGAMAQLRGAAASEGDPLLAEMLADAIKSGGTGLPRSKR